MAMESLTRTMQCGQSSWFGSMPTMTESRSPMNFTVWTISEFALSISGIENLATPTRSGTSSATGVA
jgi:hypothetical protein